jgi:hypothetical protein
MKKKMMMMICFSLTAGDEMTSDNKKHSQPDADISHQSSALITSYSHETGDRRHKSPNVSQ